MKNLSKVELPSFANSLFTMVNVTSVKVTSLQDLNCTERTRGTPRVQFANIRKMVLCQGLPHCLRLCVDPCMARHTQTKSQLKSTCLTAKFGSFLDHAETGEKGQNVISSSVQHPISLIFAIHVSFIIPLPMMWILLTKPMQKSVTTVCLHCIFARLKNKHIGVLGTNVATISWLHWSPVSGYTPSAMLTKFTYFFFLVVYELRLDFIFFTIGALFFSFPIFKTTAKSRVTASYIGVPCGILWPLNAGSMCSCQINNEVTTRSFLSEISHFESKFHNFNIMILINGV